MMSITRFQNLPPELLLMITGQITDPCDLLALRLAHPFFNSFLEVRFFHTFPRDVYMRKDCTGRYEYASINSMLFWAAQHNHLRFYRKKLLLWRHWPGFSVIDRAGLSHACVNAVRHGNADIMLELFEFMMTQYGRRGTNKIYKECFVVSLTEDQLEISKLLIDRGVRQWWIWEADNSLLVKAMEEHRLDVVEYWSKKHHAEMEEGRYNWTDRDETEHNTALYNYMRPRVLERPGADTWCQRMLSILLSPQDPREPRVDKQFISIIQKLERRNCGPDCAVWYGEKRELQKAEMLQELEKIWKGADDPNYEWGLVN